jgi:hypothetical protein
MEAVLAAVVGAIVGTVATGGVAMYRAAKSHRRDAESVCILLANEFAAALITVEQVQDEPALIRHVLPSQFDTIDRIWIEFSLRLAEVVDHESFNTLFFGVLATRQIALQLADLPPNPDVIVWDGEALKACRRAIDEALDAALDHGRGGGQVARARTEVRRLEKAIRDIGLDPDAVDVAMRSLSGHKVRQLLMRVGASRLALRQGKHFDPSLFWRALGSRRVNIASEVAEELAGDEARMRLEGWAQAQQTCAVCDERLEDSVEIAMLRPEVDAEEGDTLVVFTHKACLPSGVHPRNRFQDAQDLLRAASSDGMPGAGRT